MTDAGGGGLDSPSATLAGGDDPVRRRGSVWPPLSSLFRGCSGQRGAQYHRELDNQEDFLVLSGACTTLVEGEEHRLEPWDFVHCPPGTAHAFRAVGDAPCVISCPAEGVAIAMSSFATSLRCDTHRLEAETTDQAEAYAALPKWQPGTPAV
jgi:oxalate decarboxylase/phosphoglucose isomerase-like protein (cupin superfamily)